VGWVTSPRSLVGQILLSLAAILGWVTNLGSLGWNKHYGALEGIGRDQSGDSLWCPSMRWNQCLMDWGGLAYGSLGSVLMYVPWDPTFMLGIWHGGDWLKRDLDQPCLWWGGLWKSQTWLAFTSFIWGYFSLLIHEYYTSLYVDYMVVVSLVFLLLLCWLWECIMIVPIYGSHHIFTCKLMNKVSMA